MEYRVIRSEDRSDDVIEHDLFKGAGGKPLYGRGRQKGAQNKVHKYLARAWWRNKWRYAYTEAEVRALQMLGKAKETASEAKEAVKETTAKVKTTAEKAKSIATGNYAKAVDNKASTAKQNIARATEARNQEQQKAALATARKESADNKLFKTKKTQQTSSNASASAERASANAQKYDEARSKAQADLASAAREKETTAYKVSKAVNDTTAKVKSTANKVADTAKDVTEKAKDAPRAAAEAVVNAAEKAGKTAKKATDIATGKYAKDIDNEETKAKENYNRAKEDHDKQIQQYKNAKDRIGSNLTSWEKFATPYLNKNARTKIENTANAAERAIDNAEKARVAMGNYKADAERAARKKETTAYKVSEGVNKAKDKASDAVKSAVDKGKAKAEELFSKASNTAKSAANKVSDTARKAADIASGKYAKDVDENYNRAEEDFYNNVNRTLGYGGTAARRSNAKAAGDEETYKKADDAYNRSQKNMDEDMETMEKARWDKQTDAYKVSKSVNNAKNAVSSAAEKGKAKAEELFGKASNAAKSAAEKASNAVDKAKSEVNKQVELAKNAKTEAEYDRYGKERINKAENKISKIDKEIEKSEKQFAKDYSKLSKEDPAKAERLKKYHNDYIDSKKEERSAAVKELNDAKEWQKDWEDSDKTLYRDTDEVSDMNPNMRKLEAVTSTQRKQEIRGDEPTITEKAVSGAKSAAEKGKAKAEELLNRVSSSAKSAADKASNAVKSAASKAYDKATDEIEKVRESDAMAAVNKATDKVRDKVTDAAERVSDAASDVKAKAELKAYVNEMKRKYGTDSLHYKDAQAYDEHAKTVDDLRKARKKYGIDSPEYKQAAAREKEAYEKMNDVHEQNLYKNNAEYKRTSDEASNLGRYLSAWDERGGPKTAEGRANYNKVERELRRLEAELERMWNEDWE